jgi:disulfide bond formation protein DsbB
MRGLSLARVLALLIPAALLAGAWSFQLFAHLPPCEMCHWQRWPHYAAVGVALLSFAVVRQVGLSRTLVTLAGLLIMVSGAIAVFHAGVEWHWWPGPAHCTGGGFSGADPLRALLSARVVRCDVPAWSFLGLSIAGWNAVVSLLGGLLVIITARRT